MPVRSHVWHVECYEGESSSEIEANCSNDPHPVSDVILKREVFFEFATGKTEEKLWHVLVEWGLSSGGYHDVVFVLGHPQSENSQIGHAIREGWWTYFSGSSYSLPVSSSSVYPHLRTVKSDGWRTYFSGSSDSLPGPVGGMDSCVYCAPLT